MKIELDFHGNPTKVWIAAGLGFLVGAMTVVATYNDILLEYKFKEYKQTYTNSLMTLEEYKRFN